MSSDHCAMTAPATPPPPPAVAARAPAAPGVLRPARARLVDAVACVMGDELPALGDWLQDPLAALLAASPLSPAEAWEALAARGVIPLEWVTAWDTESPCPHGRHDLLRNHWRTDAPCTACYVARAPRRIFRGDEGSAAGAHPPTVAACVALAADAANVLAAEALAREAVARLALWGAPQPARVEWRVGAWDVGRSVWALRSAVYALPWRDDLIKYSNRSAFEIVFDAPPPLATLGERNTPPWALRWIRAHHAGYAATVIANAPPNPWTPVLDLFATGYALNAITDDAVTLVCPEVTA